MSWKAYHLGAIAYVLWGLLHVGAGGWVLFQLVNAGGPAAIALVGSAVPAEQLPATLSDLEWGILAQHAWNLAFAGVFAAVIGVKMNWRNLRIGYWLNLAVVSAVDVGFIFAILLPGYIKLSEGIWGPVLWMLAVAFTSVGVLRSPEESGYQNRKPADSRNVRA